MATVDRTGITPVGVSGFLDRLQTRWRDNFGADFALESETPQGTWIGIAAVALAEAEEDVINLANGMNLSTAPGVHLDNLVSTLFVIRGQARRSMVDVILTFRVDTGGTIPAGSEAVTVPTGNVFRLVEDVVFGDGETEQTGTMESVEFGPILAPAGSLTEIRSTVENWIGVTNPSAALQGRLAESDAELRRRYRALTARTARSTRDGLIASILEAGASRVIVEENTTDSDITRQTLTVPARGILAIVLGGEDADVGQAVDEARGTGVTMGGDTTAGGGTFQRVAQVPIAIALELDIEPGFASDGYAQIRQNLVDYSLGRWNPEGLFERGGFQIGETVNIDRLRSPILAIPGHDITVLNVMLHPSGNNLPSEPALHELYTLDPEQVTISSV